MGTVPPLRTAETIVADYLLSYSGDFGTLDDYRPVARHIIGWLKDEGWITVPGGSPPIAATSFEAWWREMCDRHMADRVDGRLAELAWRAGQGSWSPSCTSCGEKCHPDDAYRCANCISWFHRRCLLVHFGGRDGKPPADQERIRVLENEVEFWRNRANHLANTRPAAV